MASNSIGYGWLVDRYGLSVTQPLRIETVTGTTRNSVSDGYTEKRTVPGVLRPDATLAGHLTFALKHEGVHLELLSRLFALAPVDELQAWVRTEPTGQYARAAAISMNGSQAVSSMCRTSRAATTSMPSIQSVSSSG